MKLTLNIKVGAIHVNPAIFELMKQSGQDMKPMVDTVTGKIDENMFMVGEQLYLRDDSVDCIDVDISQSVFEVVNE